jgi:hypothetical protein
MLRKEDEKYVALLLYLVLTDNLLAANVLIYSILQQIVLTEDGGMTTQDIFEHYNAYSCRMNASEAMSAVNDIYTTTFDKGYLKAGKRKTKKKYGGNPPTKTSYKHPIDYSPHLEDVIEVPKLITYTGKGFVPNSGEDDLGELKSDEKLAVVLREIVENNNPDFNAKTVLSYVRNKGLPKITTFQEMFHYANYINRQPKELSEESYIDTLNRKYLLMVKGDNLMAGKNDYLVSTKLIEFCFANKIITLDCPTDTTQPLQKVFIEEPMTRFYTEKVIDLSYSRRMLSADTDTGSNVHTNNSPLVVILLLILSITFFLFRQNSENRGRFRKRFGFLDYIGKSYLLHNDERIFSSDVRIDKTPYTLKATPFFLNLQNQIESIEGNKDFKNGFRRVERSINGVFYIVKVEGNEYVFSRDAEAKENDDTQRTLVFKNEIYYEQAYHFIIEVKALSKEDLALFTERETERKASKALETQARNSKLKQFVQQDYVLRFKYNDEEGEPHDIQLLKKFGSGGPATDNMFSDFTDFAKAFHQNVIYVYDLDTHTITVKCESKILWKGFKRTTLWNLLQGSHTYSLKLKQLLRHSIAFLQHQLKNNGVVQEMRKDREHKQVYIALVPTEKRADIFDNPGFHMDGGMYVSVTSKNLTADFSFGTEFLFNTKKLEFEESIGMPFMTSEYRKAVPHLKRYLEGKESVSVAHIVNNGDTFIFHDSMGVHTIPSNRTDREEDGSVSFSMRLKQAYDKIHNTPSHLKLCQNPIDMTFEDTYRDLIVSIYHPANKLNEYFGFFIKGFDTFKELTTFKLDDSEPQPVICITLQNDPETSADAEPKTLEPYITQEIQLPAEEFFNKLYNVESTGDVGSCLMIQDFRLLTRGGKKTRRKKIQRYQKKGKKFHTRYRK